MLPWFGMGSDASSSMALTKWRLITNLRMEEPIAVMRKLEKHPSATMTRLALYFSFSPSFVAFTPTTRPFAQRAPQQRPLPSPPLPQPVTPQWKLRPRYRPEWSNTRQAALLWSSCLRYGTTRDIRTFNVIRCCIWLDCAAYRDRVCASAIKLGWGDWRVLRGTRGWRGR